MSELPQTWATCRLGDVVDYGATRKAEPDAIPVDAWVLELEDIEKDTSKVLQRLTFAQRQSKSTKNRFAAGDVLYGKLRPYLNKVVRADKDGFCTTEIIPLRPSHSLDGGYLFYWLKHPVFLDYVTAVSHGLNMPRLGTEAGRDAPFVLAPTNEQKRIADKLDAVLARVDACRERLDRMPDILRRFRQSVLAAATSGSLTEEWRRESEFATAWSTVPLESVARDFSYGSSSKSARSGAVPVLRMGNIQDGALDWSDLVYTSDPKEISKYSLSAGDVLFNRTNSPELVGKTAIYHGEHPAIYAGYLIRIRCTDRLSPDYLNYCLNSPAGRDYCWRVKSDGVSQSNINARKVAAFPITLPTILEQKAIVRRVETLFAYADRLKARYASARAQVERLTPALLDRAFCGELVPQDPHDEPASVLLERIRAARAAAPAKPRRRTPRRITKMTKLTTDTLKDIIEQLPEDRFTFDDLCGHISADHYETLKDTVFALLAEAVPSVKQVFDTEAQSMRFVRVKS